MHASAVPVEFRRLEFGRGELMIPTKVKRPLAEKVLLMCPRLATLLAAVGAGRVPRAEAGEGGRLAAMMTASRSIEPAGKPRNSFRFYIRPMC